jgi:hypothetical protein
MVQSFFKKNWPHFAAIGIFLLVAVVFSKPVTEGKVLGQSDVIGWKVMAQDAFVYKEKNGKFPVWNTRLFGGMPNYQIAMEGKSVLPDINKLFGLGLPKPINFFFMACVAFYILCLALNLNIFIAIAGALSFAFATYNPVIIGAGHESKMMAIIYAPLLLAGLLLIYQKRYWIGLGLSALAATMEIGNNHIQIAYYTFIIIVCVTVAYLFYWIRQKEWKHMAISMGLAATAGAVALSCTALLLMTNMEYAKATIRGGGNIEVKGNQVVAKKTTGLDTDYAFSYSLGRAESFVTLMPEAFGGSSSKTLGEESNVIKKLTDKNVPEAQALQVANGLPRYWGGIDGVGTAGPPYIGAITCLLALIAFVFVKHPLRWGLLAASILAFMMSWGKYLPGINTFFFNTLPLYNKFRAPSMILVILQITFPLLAVLCLQALLFGDQTKESLAKDFKKVLIVTGGLLGVLVILYFGMDYSSWMDKEVLQQMTDPNTGDSEMAKLVVSGMKADRRELFGGQVLRTLGFSIVVLAGIYAFIKNWIKPRAVIAIFGLVSTIDLFVVGKEYLPDEVYQEPEEQNAQNFEPNATDAEILKDTSPHYRVYKLAGDRFSDHRTTYFHRSVGGYHPAKLRLYQDVVERYMSDTMNMNVLNMLDAKYLMLQDPQSRQTQVQTNTGALGAAWLVKQVQIVDGPVAEINAIGYANPKDTVFIDKSVQALAPTQLQWDSSASIQLVKYDNDAIEYKSLVKTPQFAVFSEVYYPFGWNAYIDGKKTEYAKVNYVLRGMQLPAGEHKIEFKFQPSSYKNGTTISFIGSILLTVVFLGGFFMDWWQRIKQVKPDTRQKAL